MRQHKPHESGQALLLLLMMLAVIGTIAGTAAYRTISQTQETKRATEGKSAFQAAEGILEQAIGGGGVDLSLFTNLNNQVVPVVTQIQARAEAITEPLLKDSQYTLYLAPYDEGTNTFTQAGALGAGQRLAISYQTTQDTSSATDCPVLEIVFIDFADERHVSVTGDCDGNAVQGSTLPATPVNVAIGGVTFYRQTEVIVPVVSKVAIVRTLFAPTRLGFNQALPPQGTLISATARTIAGSQKTVRVFRPFPQIPAEFFVTSF